MVETHGAGPSPLRRFAQRVQLASEESEEQCELCSQPIAPQHRHLLETTSGELICVCMACSILFDRKAASLGQYRLVPDRRLFLETFQLADHLWAGLRIPVDVAYFVESSTMDRVVAYYPSPLGPTESALHLAAWQQLLQDNPSLQEMAPDVEALLVNRARGAREHYRVPISDCYRLAGLLRSNWRGINGGDDVWQQIEHFFQELRQTCRTV